MFSFASAFAPGKAARIALLYFLLAVLWIFSSDSLLGTFLDNPELANRIGMAKGVLFVAVTALLLYLLLRERDAGGARAVAGMPSAGRLLAVFLGFALVVALIGAGIVRIQGERIQRGALLDLAAIAELKAGQIESWLDERRGDAEVLAASFAFIEHVERWRENGDARAGRNFKNRLASLRRMRHYEADLLDTDGNLLLADHDGPDTLDEARRMLPEAMRDGQVRVGDLYRDSTGVVRLDYVVPLILNGNGARRQVGAVVLRAPVERFLFPLIQSWPTPSPSAETVLARREGKDVLFLNELRHRKGTALNYRVPISSSPDLPATVSILSGGARTLSSTDYRNIAVLAASRPVKGTSWYLVAKVDRSELMAPFYNLVIAVALVTLVAIGTVAGAVMLLWRQQQRTHELELLARAAERERLTKLFYELPFLGMAISSPSSKRFLHVNDCLCAMLGYSREELLELSWEALTHADDRVSILTRFQRVQDGESDGFQVEKRFLRKDGGFMDASLDARAVRREDGVAELIVATVQDITERKRLERSLKTLSARQEAILDAVPDIIMEVDANKTYTWANRAGYAFFGDDVIGREAADYFVAEQDTYEVVKPLFGGEESMIYVESRQRRRDGAERLLAWWCRALTDEAGRVVGALSSARDITENRIAEQEIRRLNADLEERVRQRTEQLQAANRELETFSYSVSHDLKAPLRGIDGYSRLLLEDHAAQLDDEGKRFLANVRAGARQMNDLIEDLLAYSRFERASLKTVSLDLEMLAKNLLGERAEDLFDVEVKLAFDCHQVNADPDGLLMALRNLLDNAIKFSRGVPAPRIEIGSRREGKSCILWVRDNGIGFDMKFHERIFELFQRLQRAEDFPGTGIGLTLVKKAMQRMGGRVWAESAPGQGAVFHLQLDEARP